jgi:hypothetical protein
LCSGPGKDRHRYFFTRADCACYTSPVNLFCCSLLSMSELLCCKSNIDCRNLVVIILYTLIFNLHLGQQVKHHTLVLIQASHTAYWIFYWFWVAIHWAYFYFSTIQLIKSAETTPSGLVTPTFNVDINLYPAHYNPSSKVTCIAWLIPNSGFAGYCSSFSMRLSV